MPQASPGKTITDSAQIAPGIIVNSDVNASAAIDYSKLNLALGIVNADVNASAAIVDTKLATIATAGKVSGAALTLLANIPAGAGLIPVANLPSLGEYSYQEKLSWTNDATAKTSTTFAAKDEILLIIRLNNVVDTALFDPVITVNGVTGTAYRLDYTTGTTVGSYANLAGWKLNTVTSAALVRFTARAYISGRHIGGLKTIMVGNSACSPQSGGTKMISGSVAGDNADVTSITVTPAAAMSGTVEIWVKTNN